MNGKALSHLQYAFHYSKEPASKKSFGVGFEYPCREDRQMVSYWDPNMPYMSDHPVPRLDPRFEEEFRDHRGFLHTVRLKGGTWRHRYRGGGEEQIHPLLMDTIQKEVGALREITRKCKNLLEVERFMVVPHTLAIAYKHAESLIDNSHYITNRPMTLFYHVNMNNVGGDVRVSHAMAIHIAHEIANGLVALYTQGWYHGKLELQNILVGGGLNLPVVKLFNVTLPKTNDDIYESYESSNISHRDELDECMYLYSTKEELAHLLEGNRELDRFAIDMYCLGMIIYYITHTSTQRAWETGTMNSIGDLFDTLKQGERPQLHLGNSLPERILTDVITTCWHDAAEYRPSASSIRYMLGRYTSSQIQSIQSNVHRVNKRQRLN